MPDEPTHLLRFFWGLLGLFGVAALIAAPFAYVRDGEHAVGSVLLVLGVILSLIALYLRRRDWTTYMLVLPQSRVAVLHHAGGRTTYQLDTLGTLEIRAYTNDTGEERFTQYEVRAADIARPLCVTQFRWLAERRIRMLRLAVTRTQPSSSAS
jgi:hypothetical protein